MEDDLQEPSAPRKPDERKPWPMWPIAVSILCFILFYTWVQLSFRKEERPFEPSRAMQQRIENAAEKNLYDWYSLGVSRESQSAGQFTDPIAAANRESPLEESLPSQIVYYLPRKPILVPQIIEARSSTSFAIGESLEIRIVGPSHFIDRPEFSLTALYKESELILLAELRIEDAESLGKIELSGSVATADFRINTQPIDTNQINISLYTADNIRNWKIEIAGEKDVSAFNQS